MYYVRVYENYNSHPSLHTLNAMNEDDAMEETESFATSLVIGSGYVVLLRNGPPETSRVGQMNRLNSGVEWVN